MALLTKRDELKLYISRRLAEDTLTELECREMVGLLKLARSGFWLNSFVTDLLCDYGAGERTSPQQVILLLAQSIDAIESVGHGSAIYYRLTGKRPEKAREQPAAGSVGAEVRP